MNQNIHLGKYYKVRGCRTIGNQEKFFFFSSIINIYKKDLSSLQLSRLVISETNCLKRKPIDMKQASLEKLLKAIKNPSNSSNMKEMFNHFLRRSWPLLLGLTQNTNLTMKLPPPLGGKSKLLERETSRTFLPSFVTSS